MTDLKDFHENLERMNNAQSKINIQNNIDKFAIAFAQWLANDWVEDERWSKITNFKELLQIFKEQRR